MKQFSKYGQLAVRAVEKARLCSDPVEAWKASAVEIFPTQRSSREKGCPKCAFLGLAEEGLIKGVQRGNYTHSKKNKDYAVLAVKALSKMPSLENAPNKLWNIVTENADIQHNEQMCVVVALWENGDLKNDT